LSTIGTWTKQSYLKVGQPPSSSIFWSLW
jgi:hypothetical protein